MRSVVIVEQFHSIDSFGTAVTIGGFAQDLGEN
jgi:hypothetical protein